MVASGWRKQGDVQLTIWLSMVGAGFLGKTFGPCSCIAFDTTDILLDTVSSPEFSSSNNTSIRIG